MAKVTWAPQAGSQTLFLACPIFECLYEGTRGPGKTDALLMDFAQHVGQGFGAAWRGILFRREYKELADVVTKSKKWFRQIFSKARFLESQSDYKWRFADGEELLFRTAKVKDDYWNYHGHEYPWIGWEELTNWASPGLYEDMTSVCRSSHPGVPRKYRATANPYGAGHNWVKARFIDPAPRGVVVRDEHGRPRVCIHGSICENKILLAADPEYIKNIEAVTDENKRKAWLHGDWNITAGGAIDDLWRKSVHEIPPFAVPKSWRVDRSFDWGSSHPFSVCWWAESDGTEATLRDGTRKSWPRGTLFLVAEYYGWNGKPNEGCRMIATDIARKIVEAEKGFSFKVVPGPADGEIFEAQNGVCIGDDMARVGVRWDRADKSSGSRVNGLERFRKYLSDSCKTPMEEPGFFAFDTCRHFLRTVPVLPRSEKNWDDIDTDAEDHIYDATRYRILEKTRTFSSQQQTGGFRR